MFDDETFLKKVLLFKNLPHDQLKKILEISEKKVFRKGQTIFTEGDPADGIYVLREGKVKVFKLSLDGKEQVLHFIGEGGVFGEVAVFLGEPFPASAEAQSESTVLFIPRSSFFDLLKNDPTISMNMLALLSLRLKEFVHLIDTISLKDVSQRVSTYLLFIAEKKDNIVDLRIKKSELASFLGTIPETLSRVLTKMVKTGLIKMEGARIEITNPEELKRIAIGEKSLFL
ncbi:MAG: Crp/Fnr family transcriptional regulator [Deltaproteobacteria bacterium]|nr:Crp/Fnr family transcriptional regulator [Deltaproteobacteria bacterium]